MPNWTPEQYLDHLQKGSKRPRNGGTTITTHPAPENAPEGRETLPTAILCANRKSSSYENHRPSSGSKPERAIQDDPLGPAPGKETNPTSRRVCIVSYRKRLIDPDNLCVKYFIDALRYQGVIADDTAKHITLEVRQEKSDNPRTEIEFP